MPKTHELMELAMKTFQEGEVLLAKVMGTSRIIGGSTDNVYNGVLMITNQRLRIHGRAGKRKQSFILPYGAVRRFECLTDHTGHKIQFEWLGYCFVMNGLQKGSELQVLLKEVAKHTNR